MEVVVQVASPSRAMQQWFALAVFVMFLHKVESFLAHEWLDSPFFRWLVDVAAARGSSPEDALGGAIFLAFTSWLFLGLLMGLLILRGGAGPIIALGIWGLTFLLELHHVFRAVAHEGYYPGLVTAVAYLCIGPFYWRALLAHLGGAPVRDLAQPGVGDRAQSP